MTRIAPHLYRTFVLLSAHALGLLLPALGGAGCGGGNPMTSTGGSGGAITDMNVGGADVGGAIADMARAGDLEKGKLSVYFNIRTSGTSANLQGVAYGPNGYAVLGYDGAAAVPSVPFMSNDGVAWTQGSFGAAAPPVGSSYTAIAASPSATHHYVVVGGTLTGASTDGGTWTPVTNGPTDAQAITWGSGYLTVGQDDMGGSQFCKSTDGTTWTCVSQKIGTYGVTYHRVIWTGALYVAVGEQQTTQAGDIGPLVLTSPNGTTWTERPTAATTYPIVDVASSGSLLVACATNTFGGDVITSSDGITWAASASAATASSNTWMSAVGWSGLYFTAIGDLPQNIASWDGLVWTSQYAVTNFKWAQMTSGGPQALVAVGPQGHIVTVDK